jgi:hypothetical protein
VQHNLLANLDDFQEEAHQPALPFPFPRPSPRDRFVPYQVNLLVDNGGAAGAPVVVEDVPTYQNLFGAIERMVDQTGKLVTNFTRIKAGSVLRAAGGFLVFNLDDALTEPLVWKPLKRVLKSGRLEIESYNPFGFLSVSGMTPEPVAVDVRLLVTGSRRSSACCRPTTRTSARSSRCSRISSPRSRAPSPRSTPIRCVWRRPCGPRGCGT